LCRSLLVGLLHEAFHILQPELSILVCIKLLQNQRCLQYRTTIQHKYSQHKKILQSQQRPQTVPLGLKRAVVRKSGQNLSYCTVPQLKTHRKALLATRWQRLCRPSRHTFTQARAGPTRLVGLLRRDVKLRRPAGLPPLLCPILPWLRKLLVLVIKKFNEPRCRLCV
jgi:hypothetical protein